MVRGLHRDRRAVRTDHVLDDRTGRGATRRRHPVQSGQFGAAERLALRRGTRRQHCEDLPAAQHHVGQVVDRLLCVDHAELALPGPHRAGDVRTELGIRDGDGDLRVRTQEGADQLGQRIHGQRGLRHHIESPGREPKNPPNRRRRRAQVAHHLPRRLHQRLPRRRQRNPVREPVEHLPTQFVLQVPDGMRQRRLGHVQRLRGSGETAVLGDGQEVLQLPPLHTLPFTACASDIRR